MPLSPQFDGARRELAEMLAFLLWTWHGLVEPPSPLIRRERRRGVWTMWIGLLRGSAELSVGPAGSAAPHEPLSELNDVIRCPRLSPADAEALFCAIAETLVSRMDPAEAHALGGDDPAARPALARAWAALYELAAMGDLSALPAENVPVLRQAAAKARRLGEAVLPVLERLGDRMPVGGALLEMRAVVHDAVKTDADFAEDLMAGPGFRRS